MMTTKEAEDRRKVAALMNAILNLSQSIDLKLDGPDGRIAMVESKVTTSEGMLLNILDMVQRQHEKNDMIVMVPNTEVVANSSIMPNPMGVKAHRMYTTMLSADWSADGAVLEQLMSPTVTSALGKGKGKATQQQPV
ncbi:uncharacterized protein LOC110264101 [Arachis ipaensis]|nr:uncharacterized protein LOC110264101 [Arachis ipaensis]